MASWIFAVLSTSIVYLIFRSASPIWQMVGLIITAFLSMKIIVAAETHKDKALNLNFKQWVCFAFLWAGMRPRLFGTLGAQPLEGAWRMIAFGVSRIALGLLLVVFSKMSFTHLPYSNLTFIPTIAILLIGLSLILHFGILSLTAGIWRHYGVPTYYLFRSPTISLSVTEFWSKRWNIAFSEMTSTVIYRPIKPTLGAGVALMSAFLFSGILHEIALSVPVNGGYGLPLLYFIIQGGVVWLEKAKKISGRLWTAVWIILPTPLLFHTHFVKGIVLPILHCRF